MDNESFNFTTDLPFDGDMEDISSASDSSKLYTTSRPHRKANIPHYSDGIFRNIGSIIKVIAFIVAFAIVVASFVVAFLLFSTDKFFMAISLALIIFGTAFGLFTLFILYGLGQVLCQNNEIIDRLRAMDE